MSFTTDTIPINRKHLPVLLKSLGYYRPAKAEESKEALDLIQQLIKYN